MKSLRLDVLESLKPLLIAFRVISSLGAQASYHLATQKWVVLVIASKKREENSMEFLAINSVVNSTKLLFPKHSRCDIVCKVAEFYLASNLEMTTL